MDLKLETIEEYYTRTKECSITKEEYSVTVPLDAYVKWKSRELHITEAFPDLSAEEREFLISGVTPDEWTVVCVDED